MDTVDKILDMPVQFVKGVGPQKAQLFKKLHIQTVNDLLYFFPRTYEDRSRIISLSRVRVGQNETVTGTVITSGIKESKKGKAIFQLAIGDDSGVLLATWFNQPFLKDVFKKGQRVVLSGKVQWFNTIQMVSPEYEILSGDDDDLLHTGRIVPIYSLTENLYQKFIRKIMSYVLHLVAGQLEEIIPEFLIKEYEYPGINRAINDIHFPPSFERKNSALNRFKFQELLLLESAVTLKKMQIKKTPRN